MWWTKTRNKSNLLQKTDVNILPPDLPLKVFDLQKKSFGGKISFQNTVKTVSSYDIIKMLPREFEFQHYLKKVCEFFSISRHEQSYQT